MLVLLDGEAMLSRMTFHVFLDDKRMPISH